MNNQNNKQAHGIKEEIDFHEAAIVNEKGDEIAITEEMVRSAIQKLDEDTDPKSEG